MDQLVGNKVHSFEAVLDEAHFNQINKNYDKALELLQPLVEKVDAYISGGAFSEDSVSQYYCFDNFFEEILFEIRTQPQKMIRNPGTVPVARVYMNYGSLLTDLNRVTEAQMALAKAVAWNPVSCGIAFEYIETFKMTKDMDTYLQLTLGVFKYAYRLHDIGRAYRNLGFYFVEKELWDEAIACYMLSMQFDSGSQQAPSELYYISQVTGKEITRPRDDYVNSVANKYGFPVGPDRDVIGIAYSVGMQCLKEENTEAGKYLMQIVYNLTGDDEIKELLEQL